MNQFQTFLSYQKSKFSNFFSLTSLFNYFSYIFKNLVLKFIKLFNLSSIKILFYIKILLINPNELLYSKSIKLLICFSYLFKITI